MYHITLLRVNMYCDLRLLHDKTLYLHRNIPFAGAKNAKSEINRTRMR